MKRFKRLLLNSLTIFSLFSCSTNGETIIKSPAEDGGLEGNASLDKVESASIDSLVSLLNKASNITKYSYEITSKVIGANSHSIMYYTPNAWYDENDIEEYSIGMAQTYGKKEVFKFYLSEDEKDVIPSIYEYAGLTGGMDKLTDLYSSLSSAHINMLKDTMDSFEAISVGTNKFLITDPDTASIFQYMTTFGSSITAYINGIYIEILDLDQNIFKVITDLGEAGDIECIFKDLTKEGTKIDFVNELIELNKLQGVDYHKDVYDLWTNKIALDNYVLEGTKLVGDSTLHRYNVHCTSDYFYLEYSDIYQEQGYRNYGYTMVEKGTPITYKTIDQFGKELSITQTLDYEACYSFKQNQNGELYFDKFIGPIEGTDLKFIELDDLSQVTSPTFNTYYIINENGNKVAYEYKEINEGQYSLVYVMDWFDSVSDFYINDISASYYFSSNGLTTLAPMFYEQDRNDNNLYHCSDRDIMGLLANGLFGWGFMDTTTWMDYVTESRIKIFKDQNQEIISANIALGINASVNGGAYKEQEVYYEIKDFGNGAVSEVEEFLNLYLGGE